MHWIVGAVLVLLIALVLDLGLLAYAMYVLLAVLAVSRFLAHTWNRGLSAERECNRLAAEIGDRVAVVVTLKNAGRLPVPWVLLEDLLPRSALVHRPPSLGVRGRRLQLVMLRGQSQRTLLYQLECNRRGYFQIGPLIVETGDLFGLHRRWQVATHPHFLLVYPRVIPLEGFDIASRRPIGEVRMTYRLYEDPTRIAGVRAYQAGDPLGRIHWHATARTGELHSKVYEPSTVAGATVLLDFHQDVHPGRDEPYRSELAVTAAASIANAVYEMGQQIGLVTNGRDAADRIRQEGWAHDARSRRAAQQSAEMRSESDRLQPVIVPTRRGADQLRRILETLARVELTDGLRLPELLTETTSRLPRDASVIVLLPSVPMETAVALGNLKRQGFAVTAIVNRYDEHEFAQAAGLLLAQGIDAHQLRDEQSVATVCQRFVLR